VINFLVPEGTRLESEQILLKVCADH
jgi:hypothetical protein